MSDLLTDLTARMDGAINNVKKEFSGLRTGRASAELLAPIVVEAYGSPTPINQVGNVSVAESRLLTVQVWDSGVIEATEKAIRDSGLGLNPQTEGNLIRIPLPDLNEERRKELVKLAKKYAEEGKIAIRNVRRDGMEKIKKSDDMSDDEKKENERDIQTLTDDYIKHIDVMATTKEKDILTV